MVYRRGFTFCALLSFACLVLGAAAAAGNDSESHRILRDVDPGIREIRISDITAVCDREKPEPQLASSVAPASASSPACVPGSTQACVGPGGCSGGQVCRPDGTGFGACDCGPAKAAAGDAGP